MFQGTAIAFSKTSTHASAHLFDLLSTNREPTISFPSPLESPESLVRARSGPLHHVETPCSPLSPSTSSSNWSSPSTKTAHSPLGPKQILHGVYSKAAFNLSELIVDISTYAHSFGELSAPTDLPLKAPSQDGSINYTPSGPLGSVNFVERFNFQGLVDPVTVGNPLTRCIPDLHLLQTPLRFAFQEVFDCLADEVAGPPPKSPELACEAEENFPSATLSVSTDEEVPHPFPSAGCPRSSPALGASYSGLLESSGHQRVSSLSCLYTTPCSLKRCPAKIKRSTRTRKSTPQTRAFSSNSKGHGSRSLIIDRAFIHQTSYFKYWTSILDGPSIIPSKLV